jgi:hypothetical protein
MLSSAADQSQNDQQDDRADEGIDDRSNKVATDYNADLREHPTSDQAADDTDDSRNPGLGERRGNVADQSVAAANRPASQPVVPPTISQIMSACPSSIFPLILAARQSCHARKL